MASEAILRAEIEKISLQASNAKYEKKQLNVSHEGLKKHVEAQERNMQKIIDDLQASVDRHVILNISYTFATFLILSLIIMDYMIYLGGLDFLSLQENINVRIQIEMFLV